MKRAFSIKEVIKKQVNWEAELDWWKNLDPQLPKYQKVVIKRNKPGWINFFAQLRP
jgi:hypothetical protein